MSCTGGFEDEDGKFHEAVCSTGVRRHTLRMCDLIRRREQAGYNLVLVIESNTGQIFRRDIGLRVDEEWDVGCVAAAIAKAASSIVGSWKKSHVR